MTFFLYKFTYSIILLFDVISNKPKITSEEESQNEQDTHEIQRTSGNIARKLMRILPANLQERR